MKTPLALIRLSSWWNRRQMSGAQWETLETDFQYLMTQGDGKKAAQLIGRGVDQTTIDEQLKVMVNKDAAHLVQDVFRFASQDSAEMVFKWAARMGRLDTMDQIGALHPMGQHVLCQTMLLAAMHEQWDAMHHVYEMKPAALQARNLTPDRLHDVFGVQSWPTESLNPHVSNLGQDSIYIDKTIIQHLMMVGGVQKNHKLLELVAPLASDEDKRWGLDGVTHHRKNVHNEHTFDVNTFSYFLSDTYTAEQWNYTLESSLRGTNSQCVAATIAAAPPDHIFETFMGKDIDISITVIERAALKELMTTRLKESCVWSLWRQAIQHHDNEVFEWARARCTSMGERQRIFSWCAQCNHTDYMQILLSDVGGGQLRGNDALGWASQHGNEEMMELLWNISDPDYVLKDMKTNQIFRREPTDTTLLLSKMSQKESQQAMMEAVEPILEQQHTAARPKRKM